MSTVPEEASVVTRDEHSPVGYCVVGLPNFPINLTLFAKPNKYLSIRFELFLGVFMSFAVGGVIVFMGFTDKDDKITSSAYN